MSSTAMNEPVQDAKENETLGDKAKKSKPTPPTVAEQRLDTDFDPPPQQRPDKR
jgi:hypothetical protein